MASSGRLVYTAAMPRTRALRRTSIAAALCLALASCASFPPLGVDRVREFTVETPDAGAELDGYRIALVTDVHYGNRFSSARLDALVETVNALGADCVILGGDHTLGYAQIAPFAEAAGRIRARDGVFAVVGNHDFFNGRSATIRTLRAAGIVVLDETVVETPRGVFFAGTNDLRDVFPTMGPFLEILPPRDRFTVLVTHNPDLAAEIDLSPFDLVLSGHTHGGQITVLGYAPRIPSEYGQRFRSGWVDVGGTPVIVSNGIGYSGSVLRFRVGAPSEIILITVRSTARAKGR